MIRRLRFKRSKRSFLQRFLVWVAVLKRKPLPKIESDPRLKEIKTFDEWLSYIKEKDPQLIRS